MKIFFAVLCISLLTACATRPNGQGYTVYLPYEMTHELGARVHLDECLYYDEDKEFSCTSGSIYEQKQEIMMGQIYEYHCPKCGAPVTHKVLMSYPAQNDYRCTKCDYHITIQEKVTSIEAPR